MSVIDTIATAVGLKRGGPSLYRCDDCGREFEVDAPPERAVCSKCRNQDVTLIE